MKESNSDIIKNLKEEIKSLKADIKTQQSVEDSIDHINTVLESVRDINKVITTVRDKEEIVKKSASILVKTRGFHNAWIALLNGEGKIDSVSKAGKWQDFHKLEDALLNNQLPACCQKLMDGDNVLVFENPDEQCYDCPINKYYKNKSAFAVKLEHNNIHYGFLGISLDKKYAADPREVDLLLEIAKDISFSFYSIDKSDELEFQKKQMFALFDGIDDVMYVADPDTYELLYFNTIARQYWGEDYEGRKCYKVLQNRNSPCPFCTNDKILGKNTGKTYVWEFQNEVNKNWYRCSDKAIKWPTGKYVRFEIATDITKLKQTQIENEKYIADLKERIKEINCLYNIDEINRDRDLSIDEFLKRVCKIIPDGWHYPERTKCCITYEDIIHKTDGFRRSKNILAEDILVYKEVKGKIEVVVQGVNKGDEPFLKEEQQLIKGIADRLGSLIEKKLYADKLEVNNQRFRDILDEMTNGVAIYEVEENGNNFRFNDINAAGLRMGNQERDDVVGKLILDAYPGAKELGVFDVLKRIHKTGNPETLPLKQYSDERFSMWVNSYMFKISTGEIIAVYNDLTEIKQAELDLKKNQEELIESRRKYKNLIDNSLIGIYITDTVSKTITFANQSLADIYEAGSPDKVIGKKAESFYFNKQSYQSLADKIQEKGKVINYEVRQKTLEGNSKYVLISGWKEKGYRMGTIMDITPRKLAEIKRRRLTEELRIKNEELEQIVYVTSHDLRSPLVNIQGFSREMNVSVEELNHAISSLKIEEDKNKRLVEIISDEIPEALGFIDSSVSKMDLLLKGLLSLSRVGRVSLTMKRVNMNTEIEDIKTGLDYMLKKKNIELETGNLPACKGDKNQLNQAFTNIIENAIKYIDPGHNGLIEITGQTKGDRVIYCIRDNGMGMDKEHVKNIFRLFHQLDPGSEGMGIGLSIVKKIIERHNGIIDVESKKGEGTAFYITLNKP